MKTWDHQEEVVTVSRKIDGINLTYSNGSFWTRNKKRIELDHYAEEGETYELFAGSWEASVSVLRHTQPFKQEYLYQLTPTIDPRLELDYSMSVGGLLKCVTDAGDEGLIINSKYKVKLKDTYDVHVIDTIPGKGRNTGRVGSLITTMGKVGTGLTDEERGRTDWIGQLIEVESDPLTPAGKFRFPRFKRIRWDKD